MAQNYLFDWLENYIVGQIKQIEPLSSSAQEGIENRMVRHCMMIKCVSDLKYYVDKFDPERDAGF